MAKTPNAGTRAAHELSTAGAWLALLLFTQSVDREEWRPIPKDYYYSSVARQPFHFQSIDTSKRYSVRAREKFFFAPSLALVQDRTGIAIPGSWTAERIGHKSPGNGRFSGLPESLGHRFSTTQFPPQQTP